MQRQSIASTNVASIGYDGRSQTLEVGFKHGGIYQYYNVNQNIYNEFLRAPSKGQFLNIYIKNAFPYSRVG